MPVRTTIALSIGVLFLLLTGCARYPTLSQSEAASQQARAALTAVRAEIREDPSLDETQREAQKRYLHKISGVVYSTHLWRALMMLEKMDRSEEESLDRSLSIVFTTLGEMARLRGELHEDGRPATPETAEAIAQLSELDLPENRPE